MKKLILPLLLLIAGPVAVMADFDLAKWKYYKDINAATGYVRMAIDDEIFAGAKRDLSDLRIIDDAGREIPYKLMTSEAKEKTEAYRPRMVNNSYLEGQGSSVVLDFGANPPTVNRLTVNTSSENFKLNVVISGSDDMESWSVLEDGAYVYDYTDARGNMKTQNTTVNFNDSVFRYLKLETIGIPIVINSVSGYKHTRSAAKETVFAPEMKVSKNEKNQTTEIVLDMKSGGIPVSKIALEIGGENFNRGAMVYSSYNQEKWQSLGQGYIFKYNTPGFRGENLILNFAGSNDRYYMVVIQNHDNEPLAIKSARAFSVFRELIFQAESGKKYRAYYNNPKAKMPVYDLEKFFPYLDLNNAPQASLFAQKDNESFAAPGKSPTPKSETMPHLMTLSLIVASLLLVFLVYRFLKAK